MHESHRNAICEIRNLEKYRGQIQMTIQIKLSKQKKGKDIGDELASILN